MWSVLAIDFGPSCRGVSTGTRVARFLLQEFLGNFYKPIANPAWLPGSTSVMMTPSCLARP